MKTPGNKEEIPESKKKKRKRIKIQFLIFISLFILLEIILRLCGMVPGNLIDDFKVQENPTYEPRFYADENGINYIIKDATTLMLGTVINNQGFRSRINYTPQTVDSIRKATNKKIVMIIGDSFVEGCCADTVTNSFPDLISRQGRYIILNMGISGTDPLQYKLVAQKFVPLLKPDLVVTAFYFGNDILNLKRIPEPNVPLTFPFKDNKWIFAIAPNHLSGKTNYNFKSAEEAYRFYVNNYTLHGENRNWFEKIIKHSVCFSKIYLATQHQWLQRKWAKSHPGYTVNANQIAYDNLNTIKAECVKDSSNYLFVGIPAPTEATENLKEKYKSVFNDIEWYSPDNLTKEDYDGMNMSNHLNNAGHKKYADFLTELIDKKIGKNNEQ
ncbi:MAG: SGNH/GDSL hydrolase family protein [Bacteroidetes bacterium]|nr:SGNH/GDSL hydrolase family protein [Bacteroidota bacterium]